MVDLFKQVHHIHQ